MLIEIKYAIEDNTMYKSLSFFSFPVYLCICLEILLLFSNPKTLIASTSGEIKSASKMLCEMKEFGPFRINTQDSCKTNSQSFNPLDYSTENEQTKYLVFLSSNGLFNRINGLAGAYALSVITGRKLVLSWEIQGGHMPASWNQLFDGPNVRLVNINRPRNKFEEEIKKAIREDYKIKHPYLNQLETSHLLSEKQEQVLDQLISDQRKFLFLRSTTACIPRNVPFAEYEKQYIKFHSLIIPKKREVLDEVTNFYQHNLEGKRVVGIHCRTWSVEVETDPGNETEADANRSASPYYQSYELEMKKILRQDNSVVFFVASDNLKCIQYLKTVFGQDKIFSYQKQQVTRKDAQDQQKAIIDALLLGKGLYIVGPGTSTLTEFAAMLTENKEISLLWRGDALPKHWGGFYDRRNEENFKRLKQKIESIGTTSTKESSLQEEMKLYSLLPKHDIEMQVRCLVLAVDKKSQLATTIIKHIFSVFNNDEDQLRIYKLINGNEINYTLLEIMIQNYPQILLLIPNDNLFETIAKHFIDNASATLVNKTILILLEYATYRNQTAIIDYIVHHARRDDLVQLLRPRTDFNYTTILHKIISKQQILKNFDSIVKLVTLDRDAVKTIDRNGQSLFFLAANNIYLHNQARFLELLLQQGADPDQPNDKGITPLIQSIFNKNRAITNVILKNTKSINKGTNSGLTPLMAATIMGDLYTIKKIKEYAENAHIEINNNQKFAPTGEERKLIASLISRKSFGLIKDLTNKSAVEWANVLGYKVIAKEIRREEIMSSDFDNLDAPYHFEFSPNKNNQSDEDFYFND